MWYFIKRGNRRGLKAIRRAVVPLVEPLESRELLSFTAELGATPGQYKNGGVEVFSLTTTGSVLPSAETFHAGDGNSYTVPSGSLPTTKPGVVTWSHTYTTTPTSAPTATVTPAGGSAITVPLGGSKGDANL